MRKIMMAAVLASVSGPAALMLAAPAFAQAAQAERYSVSETLVGKMIDDTAAAAILQKHIPIVLDLQAQGLQQCRALLDISPYVFGLNK